MDRSTKGVTRSTEENTWNTKRSGIKSTKRQKSSEKYAGVELSWFSEDKILYLLRICILSKAESLTLQLLLPKRKGSNRSSNFCADYISAALFKGCLEKLIFTCVHMLETDRLIPLPIVTVAFHRPDVASVALTAAAKRRDLGRIMVLGMSLRFHGTGMTL